MSTTLRALNDNILFTWIDDQEEEFTTSFGLVIQRKTDRSRPRWGRVISVGPLSTAKVGEYILPENVPDPYGGFYEIDGKLVEVWRTTDAMTIAVTDDKSITETMNADY